MKDEYIGNEEQRALPMRGHAMSELLAGDTRYSYYGRTVGLITSGDNDIDTVAALTK